MLFSSCLIDAEEEETTGVYSLQLHDTERQPNQVSCPKTVPRSALAMGHMFMHAYADVP